MNTIRTKKLITLSSGRWARIGFSVLLTQLFTVGAQAQTVDEGKADPLRNTNKELRTNTWSIYAQGGLSWANGVWYPNIDAKSSYKQSPAVGGGIDFTIRPWVRIGADYIWSRYRREQRFDAIDTKANLAKTYGNYVMNTHNVKLGVQFNFMELWPMRKAQWFNIWMGTGIGIKGEFDWLLNRKDVTPKHLIYAMATVRYNFVPSRASKMRNYYDGELAALNDRANNLRQEADAEKARADRESALRQKAEQHNNDLQRQLDDCQKSKKTAIGGPEHYVQFAHNSSYMSREEMDRLRSFAHSVKGEKLSILAEASTPGTPEYNQTISERRLKRVVKVLLKEGFAPEDLHPQTAIGSKNGKKTFEGRRVTIKIKP